MDFLVVSAKKRRFVLVQRLRRRGGRGRGLEILRTEVHRISERVRARHPTVQGRSSCFSDLDNQAMDAVSGVDVIWLKIIHPVEDILDAFLRT